MYKFQGVDSHHFYWRTCTDVLSKIKSSWDNGNNVLGMPSFREVFYGHKKKKSCLRLRQMAKVELLLSVFQPRKDKFENIFFCCEKEMVFTFLLDLFNSIGAGKVRESIGIFFLLSFLSWCRLNQSVKIQFSPCYCVRYVSFYPVHRFQQQFYAKCEKAYKISVHVPWHYVLNSRAVAWMFIVFFMILYLL